MKRLTTVIGAAIALWLFSAVAACTYLSDVVGQGAAGNANTVAEYSFTVFRTAWLPALKIYRAQAQCSPTQKAPCWEPEIYS